MSDPVGYEDLPACGDACSVKIDGEAATCTRPLGHAGQHSKTCGESGSQYFWIDADGGAEADGFPDAISDGAYPACMGAVKKVELSSSYGKFACVADPPPFSASGVPAERRRVTVSDVVRFAKGNHPPCDGKGWVMIDGKRKPCPCAERRFTRANAAWFTVDQKGRWWWIGRSGESQP